MIRINLLPVRQARKREYGKQQLLIGGVLILLQLVVLFVLYSRQSDQLAQAERQVEEAQARVSELQQRNRELSTLQNQRNQLQRTADVLTQLEANRAGPVQVLDELKRIMNPPVDELERISQQEQGWDTTWDPTQLWINSFTENGGALSLSGTASSNDDIAEFNTRLMLSPYFTDIRVNSVTASSVRGLGRVYTFSMNARVNYGLADRRG